MLDIQPPSVVRDVVSAVGAAGGRVYLVGGGVRDHLMHRPLKDWDLEVYGLPADALERVLGTVAAVNAVGRAFAVFKLRRGRREIDVSLPRRDSKQGPGHKGIQAVGDPTMTPAEAARRRDLTVNALMVDLHTGELLDLYGGVADLEARVLRAVDAETFLEDPLRALRVVQFAARLQFEVSAELIALCRRAELHELPEERLQAEWAKLLLAGVSPAHGLRVARAADILRRVFPELHAVDDPALDVLLDRAVPQRDACPDEAHALALMLLVWLHRLDLDGATRTLDRLKLHRWDGHPMRVPLLAALPELHAPITTDAALRHLSSRAEVELVLRARIALFADPACTPALERAKALGIDREAPPPLLQGRHLGELEVPKGPLMGQLLRAAYLAQLDGDLRTLDEALAYARTWLHERSPAERHL